MLVKCECGTHYVRENSNQIVAIDGKKWDVKCAVYFYKQEALSFRQKFFDLKDQVGQLSCFECESPVGKKFYFHGNGIYCPNCMSDIGGEG